MLLSLVWTAGTAMAGSDFCLAVPRGPFILAYAAVRRRALRRPNAVPCSGRPDGSSAGDACSRLVSARRDI